MLVWHVIKLSKKGSVLKTCRCGWELHNRLILLTNIDSVLVIFLFFFTNIFFSFLTFGAFILCIGVICAGEIKYTNVTLQLTSADKLVHLKRIIFSIAMFNMKPIVLHILKHNYNGTKYGAFFYFLCYLCYSLELLYTRSFSISLYLDVTRCDIC